MVKAAAAYRELADFAYRFEKVSFSGRDAGRMVAKQIGEAAAAGAAPAQLGGMSDTTMANIVERFVDMGALTGGQARMFYNEMRDELAKELPQHEATALAHQSQVFAPTTMGEMALPLGFGAGGYMGINRLQRLYQRLRKKPLAATVGPGKALGEMFYSRAALAFPAIFEAAQLGLSPLADPRYGRGELGYFRSVGQTLGRQMEDLSRKTGETYKRQGVLAPAFSAVHGVFNPLTSAALLGSRLKTLGSRVAERVF